MNKNTLIVGVVSFLVGAGLTYTVISQPKLSTTNHTVLMDTKESVAPGEHGMNMTMSDMSTALEGKTGDAFDRAFIEMMIDHHQGAVDMANLASIQAGHVEIKAMADEIIKAQMKEIGDMKNWYSSWGFGKQ